MAAAIVFAAGPTAAASIDDDVRCLAISFLIAGQPDEKMSQAGSVQAIYFAGKLSGRLTEEQLQQRVLAVVPTILTTTIDDDAKACSTDLGQTAGVLARMSVFLAEQEKSLGAKP